MKQIDNRQNKLMQTKAGMRNFPKAASAIPGSEGSYGSAIPHSGIVYGLLKDVLLATKIAQSAKHAHLAVHHFDEAAPLVEHVRKKIPFLIILDWDTCEAEAYKALKELRQNADFKTVPVVGFVSQSKRATQEEAQRSGCDRVYFKSEFVKHLDDLWVRYAS
ncbi:MAG: response regulator [Candidatus Omnitrophica bacterium]|nr:response regulator [Candidatus Omnitrophota bacterium]